MDRSETIGGLIAALAKAQAEFTPALKTSDNPFFNSKYADLATNIDAVRPALNRNGIAMLQLNQSDIGRQVGIVTTSLHHGEEFISVTAEAPAAGQKGFNVQSLGACWTYLRRYTLQALVGLASEDDDGNSLVADPKKAEVFAEVERQKKKPYTAEDLDRASKDFETFAEATMKHMNLPPEHETYNPTTGVLFSRIAAVTKKATKEGKEYLLLTPSKPVGGHNSLYYWHSTHREELLAAKGKLVKMDVTEKPKGITIDRVDQIDGEKLDKAPAAKGSELTSQLTASALGYDEEGLREFFSTKGEGSWDKTLQLLRQEKSLLKRNHQPMGRSELSGTPYESSFAVAIEKHGVVAATWEVRFGVGSLPQAVHNYSQESPQPQGYRLERSSYRSRI